MTRKAIIAAFACAVAGLVMLFLYMQRFEEEASGGPPVMVLVATRDIPLGSPISEDMLGSRPLPQSYVEDRHIPASEAQRILGVRVTSGVKGGESLLWTDLATTSEQRRDLSALVRNGMRAITIRADVSASFGGLLRPGDRVDVLLTTERGESREEHVTIPLLQNLLVLASGRDTGGPTRPGERRAVGSRTVNQVTLSVTLEQAAVLALAQQQGRLTLVLRNPDDIQVVENAPETTTEDIIEPERRRRIQRRQPQPEEPRLPQRVE
ncbi:MAG TPA: Flp pilus assembly protein CpaB [Sandaracinaceae bacterium LLY-WYZ-13_1]|nr:Flp pilus assembly protein CpaB [Sandaracinaceae bacterium LLY-WYZ-13_1]